jgi:DNA-binding NarL/FixJ family response regulator
MVIDDSEVVRLKLRSLLHHAEGFVQVGEAADGETGVAMASDLRPDLIVIDLRMPGMSGIEATWKLGTEAPESRVLVLSVSAEQDDVADAVMAGARGYVVKGAPDEELLAALARVAAGERAISHEVAHSLIERARGKRPAAEAEEPVAVAVQEREAPSAAEPAGTDPAPDLEPSRPSPPAPDQPPVATSIHGGWMVAIGLCGGLAVTAVGQGQAILDGTESGIWIKVLLNFAIVLGVVWLATLATSIDD